MAMPVEMSRFASSAAYSIDFYRVNFEVNNLKPFAVLLFRFHYSVKTP
jgi:hypothetical protein